MRTRTGEHKTSKGFNRSSKFVAGKACASYYKDSWGKHPISELASVESLVLPVDAMNKTRSLVHVDDDEDWGFLLERALHKSELPGWKYHFVNGGHSALEYLMKVVLGEIEPPDLVALDLRMPCLDGLHILGWAAVHLPRVPVVMLSSSELLKDRLAARDLGSKGYFSKDMAFSDFIEFLRTWDETAFAVKDNNGHGVGNYKCVMVPSAHLMASSCGETQSLAVKPHHSLLLNSNSGS